MTNNAYITPNIQSCTSETTKVFLKTFCKSKSMINIVYYLILVIAFTLVLSAYDKQYDPQILILTPYKVNYNKSLEKEVNLRNKSLSIISNNYKKSNRLLQNEIKMRQINIQKIILSEMKYSERLSFSKEPSFISFSHLVNRFYESFPHLLILLSNNKSNGNLTELKRIAEKESMQFVLNFPNIELYKKKGVSYSKIKVQLFDNSSKQVLLDSTFEGNWNNPGFEFSCKDKSIECCINNALSKALFEVVNKVASKSSTVLKSKELAQLRYDELINNYYSKPNNRDFLKTIIAQPDSNIVLNNQYQILLDKSNSKFVSFFIEEVSKQDYKGLKQNNKDKNVTIISNKNIKDEDYLNSIPQIYAYIVKGVKYNGKWYFTKSNVTYLEAESVEEGKKKYFYNLVKWGFFKENSNNLNPDFWETNLFKKIVDLRLDPDWKKYGQTSWKTREEYDRPYIGYYEIVADELRRNKGREVFDMKTKFNTFIDINK